MAHCRNEGGGCPQGAGCPNAVEERDGSFYITMEHAGFNSPANNRSGYQTRGRAIAACAKYEAEWYRGQERRAYGDAR